MGREVSIYTASITVIYCILIIWLTSPKSSIDFFKDLFGLRDMVDWVLPLVSGALAWYFSVLNVQNWFDRTFFKERKKVDNFIRKQITTPCRETSCDRAKEGILGDEEKKLMNLFYTFIPSGDSEKERSFYYWTKYWTAVNFSMISFFFTIIALIYVILSYFVNHLLIITHQAFLVILLSFFLLITAFLISKRNLIDPAEAQTIRILSDNREELKRKLPNFRTSCENCPLKSG
jgi:hypothetical protein